MLVRRGVATGRGGHSLWAGSITELSESRYRVGGGVDTGRRAATGLGYNCGGEWQVECRPREREARQVAQKR